MNGINSMKWGWFDPITGKRHDCTSPINGTLPSDRQDDDIFIVDVKALQKDCFVMWYDETNDIVFLDIGGLEPCYLLGVISTSDNTMILKNAADIEKMRVKYADDIKDWEEHLTDWKIFKEIVQRLAHMIEGVKPLHLTRMQSLPMGLPYEDL